MSKTYAEELSQFCLRKLVDPNSAKVILFFSVQSHSMTQKYIPCQLFNKPTHATHQELSSYYTAHSDSYKTT